MWGNIVQNTDYITHLALSVERVESPKICFSLIFGHMEA